MARLPADDREARLAYASGVVDRAVRSYNDLTSDEAARLIDAMQQEIIRHATSLVRAEAVSVVHFPLKPQPQAHDAASEPFQSAIRHVATDRQRWLIKRISTYLNWDDVHLEDFLTKKFRVGKLWALTTVQANGAIRLLLEVAARRDIKLRLGNDHPVSKAEINAEIPKIKDRLRLV